ncbi:MAG: GAF domain-containing protein [Anaerolineae bacterium]
MSVRESVDRMTTQRILKGEGHATPQPSSDATGVSVTSLLRIASEISGKVAAILDSDELLNTVIPLLKEGFGLYYAHVYLLDAESRELRLRAGYGEAGQAMRRRGHKIPLDAERSLVAQAARTRKPVVVNDVMQHPGFLPNALLPDTKSELALPMVVGDEVLGVFDVQDDERDAFTQSHLDVLFTLVGQIATALQNARFVERIEQNLAELSLTQFSVDHAPAAILWIRPDGTLHTVNETACQLCGYTREAFLALSSIAKLDPNMIPHVWAAHWRKVQQEKRFTIETEYRTSEGRLIPVEATANYLAYGDQEFNCIFARDISERKEAAVMQEHFLMQLNTAAQIAEQVGAILDPDELLEAVIPLLKERFQLYHAHIYVLQETDLVLKAGYGRIGRIMVEQGHRIPLRHPRSLVARAARTREAVVVNDVSKADDFLPNLLLPKTRSEVAVPIVIGDEVLGVFDVQSEVVGFFTASDIDVFRTLSGQLANALYAANLFERRRRAEQELRTSAQTVRAIFNAMTEGIIVTDMMGRILEVNEAALSLYGYDSQEALVGRSMMELLTESGWEKMAANTQEALASGRAGSLETKMVRKDGSYFDAEQSSALLWDPRDEETEEPRGIVSIVRDVTAQKRTAREIARFKALTENAVDAVVMADFSGQVTYANEAAHRLFGRGEALASLLDRTLSDLWPDDEVGILIEEALPAAGDGGWQAEVRQRRGDGTVFDAALTMFSVKGETGVPIGVAMIVRDITRRKLAEAELQQFAMQLRTAADVSAKVTAILDPVSLLESVVPLLRDRFGLYHVHVYTAEPESGALVMQVGSGEAGRVMREQGHRIPMDKRPSLVAKAARTRQVVLVDDVRAEPAFLPNPLLPDTRSEVAIPMVAGDELIGVFDVQDSVPSRFSESDVDVFSALAVQIAIALRNAQYFNEMEAVAERLREVDRLKSEFLANMSHELRTPLNSILGYAEVLLMGLDGDLSPEMQEDVEAIFDNGQQLLHLINDILDLTKIEAGRMALSLEPIDVPSLLEEARSHNLGLIHKRARPIELQVMQEEGLPQVMADPTRMAQILNNLISNAIKFTDEGTIELRAYYEPAQGQVCIEVADGGVGIAPEHLPHLFERFRQVDGSSTRRAEGTGLGLAITKQLVELHGGVLRVESEVGKGSVFTVCLPAVDEETS